MSKAGTEGAGPPESPSLLSPEDKAARRGSEWPRTAGSGASSGIVSLEILAEKISWLRQAGGGAYRAACNILTSRCCETGLESGDTLAYSQNMVNRGQEEEETIEQARTQLERLRRLEGGRNSSDSSSDGEPTQEIDDTNYLEEIWLKSEIVEESKVTEIDTAPPSTTSKVPPTPVRPGDGLLKLMAMNPPLAKAPTRPEGLFHPSRTPHSSMATTVSCLIY